MPPYMRQPGGWYEYDCDWAIAYCACEDAFRASASFTVARLLEDARETLRRWHPAEYACFYGVPPTAALDGSDAFDPRVVWTDAQVRFSVIRDSTRTSEYEVLDRNTGKMVELVGIRGDRLHACDEVAEWVIDFKVAADVESGKLGAALDEAESQAFGPGYRRLTDGVVILARRR